MIMGLERLDRITAFMEEQSGPMRPVEFPPPRHPGPPSTIKEDQESDSARGYSQDSSGGAQQQPSSSSGSRAQDGGLRPESSADSRERLASSAGAGTSGDGMSGRDRVNAAIASLEIREELSQAVAALDSRKSHTESLDGQVCPRAHDNIDDVY